MPSDSTHFYGSFDELRPYGVNLLTGESCAYSMRMLCDVSEKGAKLLSDFLGGNVEFRPGSNWNSKVGDDPAVASVMLTHDMLSSLTKFICFRVHNYQWLITFDNSSTVIGTNEQEWLRIANEQSGAHIFTNLSASAPSRDGRNVHAFSGRTI